MANKSANILFDDIFTISAIDNARYERVSRLQAHSTNFGMDLSLDFNNELYPLRPEESFTMVLASSLRLGQASGETTEQEVWRPDRSTTAGLDAEYEYVMHGKIYKFDEGRGERVTAYASFGGLLLALSGSFRHMTGIVLGEDVFLLLRRLSAPR